MKKIFSLMLGLLALSGMLGACSNSDEEPPAPVVPDNPAVPSDTLAEGEIPMAETAPTAFNGAERMEYDTIPFGAMGMHDNYVPVIHIYKETESGKLGITREFDSELYLTDQDNNTYRVGDKLPGTTYDLAFGHTIRPMYSDYKEIGGLSFGAFSFSTDKSYVLHWPSKKAKVFFRLFSDLLYIKPDCTPWEGPHDRNSDGSQVFQYGMYVNGHGLGSHLWIKVTREGEVRLYDSALALHNSISKPG